MISGFKW